jgi:integrase
LVPHLVSEHCCLNEQARDIALVMVNTGARLSEVANLTRQVIHLDNVDVSHIEISGEDRELKTSASERKIPLVGVSLAAMKKNPDGFPRYADKPGLSGTLNAYLRENGLLEGAATIYSLRHSFEDRQLVAEVDERIRRDLMGHALGGRQRYGAGMPLARVSEILAATAV